MTISPSDPFVILAGIKQFGLAADGSDLRDLTAALERYVGVENKIAGLYDTIAALRNDIAAHLEARRETQREGYEQAAKLIENNWPQAADFIRTRTRSRGTVVV